MSKPVSEGLGGGHQRTERERDDRPLKDGVEQEHGGVLHQGQVGYPG